MIAYTLVLVFNSEAKNSVFPKLLIKHTAGFNFPFRIKNISVVIHILL